VLVRRPLEAGERLELLVRPRELAGTLEAFDHRLAQLQQRLDIECGVLEPRSGQRPGRPVDRRVLLGQGEAQQAVDQRGESHRGRFSSRPASSVSNSDRGYMPIAFRHGRS
jgi:hypothetical protein